MTFNWRKRPWTNSKDHARIPGMPELQKLITSTLSDSPQAGVKSFEGIIEIKQRKSISSMEMKPYTLHYH